MEANTKPGSDEQLGYPTNHVLAVFKSEQEAQAATTALKTAGCTEDDITALVGPGDAHRLDAAAGQDGFFGRLAAGAINMGDDASGNISHYREVLSGGGAVVAVAVKKDDQQQLAQTMAANGGSFIYYYSRFTVVKLS